MIKRKIFTEAVKTDLNNKYKIVLGVSFEWGNRKGQDIVFKLRELLDDEYIIVMVGTNKFIEKVMPKGIVSIQRTADQAELAKIYTAADVFVNPTRDEALGMVNIEALACGTPVVTFSGSGSQECIDEKSGLVAKKDNVKEMVSFIKNVCCEKRFDQKNCIERARLFSNQETFKEYVSLYYRMLGE